MAFLNEVTLMKEDGKTLRDLPRIGYKIATIVCCLTVIAVICLNALI